MQAKGKEITYQTEYTDLYVGEITKSRISEFCAELDKNLGILSEDLKKSTQPGNGFGAEDCSIMGKPLLDNSISKIHSRIDDLKSRVSSLKSCFDSLVVKERKAQIAELSTQYSKHISELKASADTYLNSFNNLKTMKGSIPAENMEEASRLLRTYNIYLDQIEKYKKKIEFLDTVMIS